MDFKEKCARINAFIRENRHKYDWSTIESIYSIANLGDNHTWDFKRYGRLNGTNYSHYTDEQLYKMFDYENFKKLSKNKLENLFQEVYNRQSEEANCSSKYYCVVDENEAITNNRMQGYLKISQNDLVMNGNIIHKVLNDKPHDFKYYTKESVGPMMMMVVTHETEHSIQNEKILDFVLGNKLSEDDEFLACMDLISLHLMSIKDYARDKELEMFCKESYKYDYTEHDANMKAMRTLEDLRNTNQITDSIYNSCAESFARYTMRFPHDKEYNNQERFLHIREQVTQMRKVAIKMFNYYNRYSKNTELKRRVSKVMHDYLEFDKNKDCKYIDKLIQDYKLCDKHMHLVGEQITEESRNNLEIDAKSFI